MDYKPRYAQPFTLKEAIALDVSVITEEITRLQNSLQHLRQTQETLHEYITSEPPTEVDPEIMTAIEENKTVIGSQEERIMILKMALAEKGVFAGNHYDLAADVTPAGKRTTGTTTTTTTEADADAGGVDGGVHL